MGYQTGWFGIPGRVSTSVVHIVYDGKCICGAKFSPLSQFQFCANRIYLLYVTCNRCKERLHRHQEKIIEIEMNRFKKEIDYVADPY